MKKAVALIVLLLVGLLLTLFARGIRIAALSGLTMIDVLRPGKPPLLRLLTREPTAEVVRFAGGGRQMEADLYVPRRVFPGGAGKKGLPGIILVHGVNEVGKADPRIIWAAQLLGRSGFVVLVPDFFGFKSLQLRPSDIGEIVDSFLYLASRQDLVRPDRLGIAGFSYGAGPTLIAGCDPRIRGQVDFLVSFGGYFDLGNVIQFATTGTYAHGGQTFHRAPDDYTRWIFLHHNLELLPNDRDRKILEQTQGKAGEGTGADLLRQLSPEGQAVFRLLSNRDPERTAELLSELSPAIHHYIEALSPSRYIRDLKAYLFIVHGVPDAFVPHTESLHLYDALPDQKRARLTLLRIFSHVRPSLPQPTPSNILRIYLPEGMKFYALLYDLMDRPS